MTLAINMVTNGQIDVHSIDGSSAQYETYDDVYYENLILDLRLGSHMHIQSDH